jgi:hypothetical protein
MSERCKMGCLYASQEQRGDEMSASINTDTLHTDRREMKRGLGRRPQSLVYPFPETIRSFQDLTDGVTTTLHSSKPQYEGEKSILKSQKPLGLYVACYLISWMHKRRIAVESREPDFKSK